MGIVDIYPSKISVPDQKTENVSFKVSLLKENGEKSEVRRFVVPQDCSSSLIYLKEKIRTIFNLGRSNCKVSWKDEDNDDVTIETDEEMLIALQELVGPVYKLQVVRTEADFVPDHHAGNGNTNQENQKQDGEVHYGVSCDGCDGPVQGFRYKCMVCPDFDLCSLCEAKGLHPGHNMIRIASPESIWPRHFMNRLHKMNARAARCHSSNAANETKKDDKKSEETANSEGGPQNFGPWNWSARHGQRRHRDHGGHGGSSTRPRSAFGASNFAGTGSMDDPVIADVDFSDLANLQANLHKHLSQHFGKHFGTPMTPPCGGQKAKEDSTTTTEAAEAAPEATPEPAAKEVKPQEATSTPPKEELSPRMKKVR